MGNSRIKPKVDGAYYHLMTRTAQSKFWLDEFNFKKRCYEQILTYCEIFYCDLFAVTCLSNHYHICLKMNRPQFELEEVKRRYLKLQALNQKPKRWFDHLAESWYENFTDLSKLMWYINRGLALQFNRTAGTKGHLWGSRFKSVLIEDGETIIKRHDLY